MAKPRAPTTTDWRATYTDQNGNPIWLDRTRPLQERSEAWYRWAYGKKWRKRWEEDHA